MSEFADLYGEWATLGVVVATWRGSGRDGPLYEPAHAFPDDVPLAVMPQQRLVPTAAGSDKMSTTAIAGDIDQAERFAVGSRVTLPDGTKSTVLNLSTARHPMAVFVANLE